MNTKTFIFIGRSGCGKGTQAEKLADFIKSQDAREIFHLEAGQRFRDFIKQDTYSSSLSRTISQAGVLQPEFLSVWAWSSDLITNLKEGSHMFIDGTPRRQSEALILESAFGFYQRKEVHIIYINVSREWATDRMTSRGRADDLDKHNVAGRLNWFDKDVMPVVDFYRNHNSHKFHEINGEQDIEKVHADILESMGMKI